MFNNINTITKSHTLNDLSKNIIDDNNKLLNIVVYLDQTIIYTKIFHSYDIIKIVITEYIYNDYYLSKFTICTKTYLIFIRPFFKYNINIF